mmetsp:Transcript_24286/g.55521  ORF Transcript_24286/g.55521 Transcript_24286/m.55521 type:complete len:474 (-) Transcript_24286:508-1929(-)
MQSRRRDWQQANGVMRCENATLTKGGEPSLYVITRRPLLRQDHVAPDARGAGPAAQHRIRLLHDEGGCRGRHGEPRRAGPAGHRTAASDQLGEECQEDREEGRGSAAQLSEEDEGRRQGRQAAGRRGRRRRRSVGSAAGARAAFGQDRELRRTRLRPPPAPGRRHLRRGPVGPAPRKVHNDGGRVRLEGRVGPRAEAVRHAGARGAVRLPPAPSGRRRRDGVQGARLLQVEGLRVLPGRHAGEVEVRAVRHVPPRGKVLDPPPARRGGGRGGGVGGEAEGAGADRRQGGTAQDRREEGRRGRRDGRRGGRRHTHRGPDQARRARRRVPPQRLGEAELRRPPPQSADVVARVDLRRHDLRLREVQRGRTRGRPPRGGAARGALRRHLRGDQDRPAVLAVGYTLQLAAAGGEECLPVQDGHREDGAGGVREPGGTRRRGEDYEEQAPEVGELRAFGLDELVCLRLRFHRRARVQV